MLHPSWPKSPSRTGKRKVMKRIDISVIINTRNEEINIKDCIESAKLLTDNINVIDMESEDRTAEIASKMGTAVYSFPFSHYVEPARGAGVDKSKTDWVLILDA